MLKKINDITVFIIELTMIGAFAYFGSQKGNSLLMKYFLAFALPVIVILLWGYFAAPKSSHRLKKPYLLLFRGALFLLSSYLLYKCNKTNLAVCVALLSIATQSASYFFDDRPE